MAPEVEDSLTLLRPYSKADVFVRPASAIRAGALRLEAGFYGSQGYRAVQAMEDSGFQIERVGQHAKVHWFGPFSRTYVNDPAHGTPFLSSSDMMAARLETQNYLSNALTRDLSRLMVAEGTILVSCSGTIGNVCYCTSDYNGHAVSQHAIRVDALEQEYRGLLYVYLLSGLGRFLITRNKSGSVIESIYAEDVERLPLPLLPKRLRQRINEDIVKTSRLRVEANRLLKEAERRVQMDFGLPDINTFQQGLDNGHAITFSINAADKLCVGEFGQLRLDATFHSLTVERIRDAITARSKGARVKDVAQGVYRSSLRMRHYVDEKEYGIPMIGGKQMMHTRPEGIKHLSSLLTRNIKHEKILPGTCLVTCGGTVGRALYAHRNYEGWVASEHIMKIVPNKDIVAPGYLYAFMASPFGSKLIEALMHGSVIPQIRDFEFGDMPICVPIDRGYAIHDLVEQAFDLRADAKDKEDGALDLFMSAVQSGKLVTEQKWGWEY